MKIKFSFLLSILPIIIYGQVEYLSYQDDRIFTTPRQLYGHTFVPNKGKLSTAHYPDPIKMGTVIFEITSTGVLITEQVEL